MANDSWDDFPLAKSPSSGWDAFPRADSKKDDEAPNTGMQGAMLHGIPVAGPLIEKGMDAALAGVQTGVNKLRGSGAQTFGENYADVHGRAEAGREQYAQEYPYRQAAGEMVGSMMALGPLGATGVGEQLLGLTVNPTLARAVGSVGARTLQSGAFGAGLGGADAAARGEDIGTGALIGGLTGAALPPVGAALGAAGRGIRNAVQPFTQAGQEARADRILGNAFTRGQGGGLAAPTPSPIAGAEPTFSASLYDPATGSANAGVAQLERTLRNHPETNPFFSDLDTKNNLAAHTAYDARAGDEATLAALEAARAHASDPLYQSARDNATAVRVNGAVRVIDNTLAGRAGQVDAVRTALQSIRDKLALSVTERAQAALQEFKNIGPVGAQRAADFQQAKNLLKQAVDGTIDDAAVNKGLQALANKQKIMGPIDSALDVFRSKYQTNFELLQGVRDDINKKIKFPFSEKSQAANEMLAVRDALDHAMDAASGGRFSTANATYATMSKPIDVQTRLQKFNPTPPGSNNITASRMDTLLNQLERERHPSTKGANTGKSFSAADMQALEDIRQHLAMQNAGLKQGMAPGSNTVQNLMGAGVLERLLANKVSHDSIGGALTGAGLETAMTGRLPTFGALAGGALGGLVGGRYAKGYTAIRNKLAERALNPSLGAAAIKRAALPPSSATSRLLNRIANPLLISAALRAGFPQ